MVICPLLVAKLYFLDMHFLFYHCLAMNFLVLVLCAVVAVLLCGFWKIWLLALNSPLALGVFVVLRARVQLPLVMLAIPAYQICAVVQWLKLLTF